ncbi:hypothetical protein IMSHALPRED_004462 [Imshaugia aleurites]|uniref:Uncharacterized protein n=1 Tax=Imshaugia aleurites TaxID=172621 RepID=A0A8H3F8B3_9LECA|nr:hypothetical protein IMSHALPRED_004462 [Imshaugia aleurites]
MGWRTPTNTSNDRRPEATLLLGEEDGVYKSPNLCPRLRRAQAIRIPAPAHPTRTNQPTTAPPPITRNVANFAADRTISAIPAADASASQIAFKSIDAERHGRKREFHNN